MRTHEEHAVIKMPGSRTFFHCCPLCTTFFFTPEGITQVLPFFLTFFSYIKMYMCYMYLYIFFAIVK